MVKRNIKKRAWFITHELLEDRPKKWLEKYFDKEMKNKGYVRINNYEIEKDEPRYGINVMFARFVYFGKRKAQKQKAIRTDGLYYYTNT